MNAGECKGGARAGRFRPERHQRKARVSSGRWEMLMASMCFTAPAGAPAVPGRRHECGRVQGWGRAGRFRPERHQRKARVSSGRWEM
ncbi:hypothetical protein NDU88_004851 [Pleurodeles waltl]|uniref:Uncharacterized protein n=1 Tax=Pleurodeles waltl TaxID=8319 RepID=A0AAV7T9K9_PLEWA|nr:hypothetical protein NDU88_004851 [Pleurodeles waltl]